MAQQNFPKMAKAAFDQIKCGLGVDADYQPKAGGSHEIRGIFDDRVQEVDPDTEQPITSQVFTLGIELADLPSLPVKGDAVFIDDVEFRVIEIREDGVPGVSVVLILHKV